MKRLCVGLVLLSAFSSFGWGFDGHRRLASLMQDALPQNHCLRSWLAARQTTTLQDHACDPDRWRGTDAAEAPRHYLEVDWVSPITNYPRDYDAVVALLGARNAANNGIVPWRVEQKYAELVAAFRANDTAAILDVSFVMSHYVFDSFSVLHDTKNFDPNNGLHARWESDMLNVLSNLNGVTTLATTYYGTPGLSHPRDDVFAAVLTGNPLVGQLIAADTAAAGSIPSLYSATRELTARRWGDGVTLMSSLLWTAWAEAGSPELTGFSTGCLRSTPSGSIVFLGYPPGGQAVDAGVPDAGSGDGADAGMGGGGDGAPVGCGCSSLPVDAVFALLIALTLSRRGSGPSPRPSPR